MQAAKYSGGPAAEARAAWLVFTVGPSAIARAWAYGVVAVGVSVALWLPLSGWARAGLVLAVIAGALRAACREGCRSGGPATVSLSLAGEVTVEQPGQAPHGGALHPGSVVFTRLVVVRYQPAACRFTRAVLVLPDAADPEAFRRLRVLLRSR